MNSSSYRLDFSLWLLKYLLRKWRLLAQMTIMCGYWYIEILSCKHSNLLHSWRSWYLWSPFSFCILYTTCVMRTAGYIPPCVYCYVQRRMHNWSDRSHVNWIDMWTTRIFHPPTISHIERLQYRPTYFQQRPELVHHTALKANKAKTIP